MRAWSVATLALLIAACGDSRSGSRHDSGPPPHDGGRLPDAGPPIDNTYISCLSNAGCDVGDGCFYVAVPAVTTEGKLCTHDCASDAQCEGRLGFSGACYAFPPDPNLLCYQRCAVTGDCYADTKCTEVSVTTGATDSICLPNNHALP